MRTIDNVKTVILNTGGSSLFGDIDIDPQSPPVRVYGMNMLKKGRIMWPMITTLLIVVLLLLIIYIPTAFVPALVISVLFCAYTRPQKICTIIPQDVLTDTQDVTNTVKELLQQENKKEVLEALATYAHCDEEYRYEFWEKIKSMKNPPRDLN